VRLHLRRALCLGLLALAPPAAAETPFTLSTLIVEPDQAVAGLPLATYANFWWQWALSMPQSESPIVDQVGNFCGVGQSGPVWFLAGGYGSSKIRRTCEVPAGRHLFFPVINVVQIVYPATADTCPALKAEAAANNDTFVYLKVILDDEPLEKPQRFRIASQDCFDPFARTPAAAEPPADALAATDGYWIMLQPLPPGPHRLEFRAFYTNPDEAFGDMVQNIDYDLTVLAR
jgi:hypothetical protein